MSEGVVCSIITGIITFAGFLVTNSKTMAILQERIDQLEKKQDKHNCVIERTYILEKNQAVMQEEIKVANHRIEDLEKGGN